MAVCIAAVITVLRPSRVLPYNVLTSHDASSRGRLRGPAKKIATIGARWTAGPVNGDTSARIDRVRREEDPG
ncbi:hypothetical protein GCM10017691_48070 [Pseudonocardia petroleophila]